MFTPLLLAADKVNSASRWQLRGKRRLDENNAILWYLAQAIAPFFFLVSALFSTTNLHRQRLR
jgi:hypothetical protein